MAENCFVFVFFDLGLALWAGLFVATPAQRPGSSADAALTGVFTAIPKPLKARFSNVVFNLLKVFCGALGLPGQRTNVEHSPDRRGKPGTKRGQGVQA